MHKSHWLYPLLTQQFGNAQRQFLLIPHRSRSREQSRIMIQKIESKIAQELTLKNITMKNKIVEANTMMLSEVYEMIIRAIKASSYIYNQECFIGIDMHNNTLREKQYDLDEQPFAKNTNETLSYFTHFIDLYNPLLLLNPFAAADNHGYAQLRHQFEEKLFIGLESLSHSPVTSLALGHIHNQSNIAELEKKIHKSHENKQKYVAICDSTLSESQIKKISEEITPDFIQAAYL